MANNEWRTPDSTYNFWDNKFNFQCDVAASSTNTKHTNYFDNGERGNGLKEPWGQYAKPGTFIWCNPPFSAPLEWARKAIREQSNGVGTVMLLNADFSTKAACLAVKFAQRAVLTVADWTEGEYYTGRMAFYDEQGNIINQNRCGQVFFVFNPFPDRESRIVTDYISILTVQPEKPPGNARPEPRPEDL